MTMKMPQILGCEAENCSYNNDRKCHAMAITVGDAGGECPLCDTSIQSQQKSGVEDMMGGVGACKLNTSLECTADRIQVKMHSDHPECGTFQAK